VKLIGYARVSTRQQDADLQRQDLLAAGARRDDLYVDHGVSGARASHPAFDRALDALHDGDTLVVTTLDRLGRSTIDMLSFAAQLRDQNAGLRVLNLGGGDVDTATPTGSMVFSIMAALAQMELEIKRDGSATPSPNAATPARTSEADAHCSLIVRSAPLSGSSTRRVGVPRRPRPRHVPNDPVSPHTAPAVR